MGRGLWWGIWIAVLAPSWAWAQTAAGKPASKTDARMRVEIDSVWAHPFDNAPYPIRIKIENYGPARAVDCRINALGGWRFGNQYTIRRRLAVHEKDSVQFTMLVPAMEDYHELEVWVEGHDEVFMEHGVAGSSHGPTHLVVDRRVDITGAELEAAFGTIARGGSHTGNAAASLLAPNRLSDQWQAYAGVAGVWVRAEDWKEIAIPHRQAILRAVKGGQQLVVYDAAPGALPASLELGASWVDGPADPKQSPSSLSFGFGRIAALTSDIRAMKDAPGQLHVAAPANGADFNRVGIPGVGQVPYSIFFWIVLVFALLIGPINFVIVHKIGNRLLFLLTTPALAVFSVIILFGYSAVRDGFSTRATVATVTLLNATDHEAITLGRLALYSGLASGTWRCSPDSLWWAISTRDDDPYSYYYRRRRNAAVRAIHFDWSRGQEIGGSWVPARRLVRLATTQVAPSRHRLSLDASDPRRISVSNGLGAPIEEGLLVWEGAAYAVPRVADGAAAELQPISPQDLRARLEELVRLHEVVPYEHLVPRRSGAFLVRMSRNPMLETGEKELEEIQNLHLVRGEVSR